MEDKKNRPSMSYLPSRQLPIDHPAISQMLELIGTPNQAIVVEKSPHIRLYKEFHRVMDNMYESGVKATAKKGLAAGIQFIAAQSEQQRAATKRRRLWLA